MFNCTPLLLAALLKNTAAIEPLDPPPTIKQVELADVVKVPSDHTKEFALFALAFPPQATV